MSGERERKRGKERERDKVEGCVNNLSEWINVKLEMRIGVLEREREREREIDRET